MLEVDPLFLDKNANDPTAEMPFVPLCTVLTHAKEAGCDYDPDPLPSLQELEELCLDWEGKCLLDYHNDGNGYSPSTRARAKIAFPNMLHVQLAYEFAMTGSEYLSFRERWAILFPTGRTGADMGMVVAESLYRGFDKLLQERGDLLPSLPVRSGLGL